MANLPSNFERMITNNVPVQESLLQYLTRWDFRNLQLAGVRIPISQKVRRKYQKPTRCDEDDPENPGERCVNSTKSVDEVRACAGHPLITWNEARNMVMTTWLGAQNIEPCFPNKLFPDQESNPDNEPNISEYPIHTKVCRSCRDFDAAILMDDQLMTISNFGRVLCKRHSLEWTNQFPINACHCFDFINGKWRCHRCSIVTLDYLETRANFFDRHISLQKAKIPWSQPWAYLRNLWTAETEFCPIEGCMQQPWLNASRKERMQLCLGCNAISRVH